MKYIPLIFILITTAYAQTPVQRNLSLPRGDPRTLQFTTGTDVQNDSIVFSVTLFYQESFSASSSVVLRKGNSLALNGNAEQVFTIDSLIGTVQVYISTANSAAMGERQYYYSLRVNDTTKFYGAITMYATVFANTVFTFLTTLDSNNWVSRTNPNIPGMPGTSPSSADSNRIVIILADGSFELGWDDRGTGITTSDMSDTLDANVMRKPQTTVLENLIAGKAGADSVQSALAANDADILTNANGVAGKADADSVNVRFVTQDNQNAGFADGDSVQTALLANDGDILTLQNQAGGFSDADSVQNALLALENSVAGKADADSMSTQITLLKNIAGGKGDSDSLSTTTATANAAIAPGDGTLADSSLIPGSNITFGVDAGGTHITISASGGVTAAAVRDTTQKAWSGLSYSGLTVPVDLDVGNDLTVATGASYLDSARMRIRIIDSTGWINGDSAQWRVTIISDPALHRINPGKIGYVEFEIFAQSLEYFDVATDSTNEVEIIMIQSRVRGFDLVSAYLTGGEVWNNHSFNTSFKTSEPTSGNTVLGGYDFGNRRAAIRVREEYGSTAAKYPLDIFGIEGGATIEVYATIRVYFTIPAANSSTFYVTLQNL